MQINLLAIQNKPPAWCNDGYTDYAKRLPKNYHLNLISIAAIKRNKNSDINKTLQVEGKKLLSAIPSGDIIIALDRIGTSVTTKDIACKLQKWHDSSQNISLLIGGPEGLSQECIAAAHYSWSLSSLTFPHPLVKVVLAEQIYRAWSIITKHPYHR